MVPTFLNGTFLIDGAFSQTIFYNFHHKFSLGLLSKLFTCHVIYFYVLFLKKSFNPFCSVTKCIIILKNDFTNFLSMEWENHPEFQCGLDMCVHCWDNDCHLLWSFKWHATPDHEWLGKFTCFLLVIIFICFIWHLTKKNFDLFCLPRCFPFLITHFFYICTKF